MAGVSLNGVLPDSSTLLLLSLQVFSFFDDEHIYSQQLEWSKEKFEFEARDGYVTLTLSLGLDKNDPWERADMHLTGE